MYNSKEMCMDNELTFLSFEQKINKEFSVQDIVEGDLWKVYDNGGVYKCIPLFNCDVITSSNSKDIVVEDNKCLILTVDDDTVVTVSSEDTSEIHYYSVEVYAFTPYSKLDVVNEISIYCIVYDEYLNTLNNVLVDVVIDGDNVGQIQTNSQGIAKYTVTEPCEIGFMYDENESNTIIISGGE